MNVFSTKKLGIFNTEKLWKKVFRTKQLCKIVGSSKIALNVFAKLQTDSESRFPYANAEVHSFPAMFSVLKIKKYFECQKFCEKVQNTYNFVRKCLVRKQIAKKFFVPKFANF